MRSAGWCMVWWGWGAAVNRRFRGWMDGTQVGCMRDLGLRHGGFSWRVAISIGAFGWFLALPAGLGMDGY